MGNKSNVHLSNSEVVNCLVMIEKWMKQNFSRLLQHIETEDQFGISYKISIIDVQQLQKGLSK